MKTQEEAMAKDELNPKIAFYCVECNKKHFATEEIYPGLAKIPDTLISKRNSKQEYYLQCVSHGI